MLTISLPDGSQREFERPVTVADVAYSIGPGLAKAALAGAVDDILVDLSYRIEGNANLRLITDHDEEGLAILRHSTAHLLAQAVKSLYPEAQVTIGPVIEDGFYYDFAYERTFTPDDLSKIEAKMLELVKEDLPLTRQVMSREQAIDYFQGIGEHYKAEIIQSIAADESLSLYTQGDFTDLCRGPHVPSTGKLRAFKLTKLAGAYWRGNANNEMLQRIYGTAWPDKKALKVYLHRLEEAEKRDHRKIAKAQDLFHIQEEGPGMVFWHPKGWSIYQTIERYMRNKLIAYDYEEIRTPQMLDKSLWVKSGHADKYGDDMFKTLSEDREFAIKPMSCPGHVQVFKQGLKSYRDLPLRMSEFGCCHRNELSGALHGLMRVRQFVQDDAHIFCTEAQIQEEIATLIVLIKEVFSDFGFTDLVVELSTRPEKRIGSDAQWDHAETALSAALDANQLVWQKQAGEGAFYGPKIDFSLKDSLGRIWQTCTIQLDYCMPERLEAHYIDEQGEKAHPVMIHRAIMGSFERFIGILLEEYAGIMPVWLAPYQVAIMNITDKQAEYSQQIDKILKKHGFRCQLDLRNELIRHAI